MVRHSLFALASLALCACGVSTSMDAPEAPPAGPAVALSGPTVVPLLRIRGNPFVRAEIPGHGVATLLVDTGAEVTLLDESFACGAGLELEPYAGSLTLAGVHGSEMEVTHFARVSRMELGDGVVTELLAPIADLSHVHRDMDGILGQDVLRHWTVIFDARGRRVILAPHASVREQLARLISAETDTQHFPVTWQGGIPVIEMPFGAHGAWEMAIDTGSTSTSLPLELIGSLGLRPWRSVESRNIGGTTRHDAYGVRELDLGKFVVPRMRVDPVDGTRGILGYDPLARFVFVMDGPGDELWLLLDPAWSEEWDF